MLNLDALGGVKAVREAMCVAQVDIGRSGRSMAEAGRGMTLIAKIIDACDVHRPLGPDGKHGTGRCTPTCGCVDKTYPEHGPSDAAVTLTETETSVLVAHLFSQVVGADHEWTDESRPFVLMFAEPLSAREAALTIVGEAVWSSMLDGSCDDLSALEWAGLVAVLNDVSELSSAAHIDRFTSGVLAWFTSRMVRSVMCVADGHDGGDGRRWFGRCDADEDDDECPTCSSRVRGERLDLDDDVACGAGWHDEPSASPHHMMDIWFVEGDAAEFVPFVIALAERWLR